MAGDPSAIADDAAIGDNQIPVGNLEYADVLKVDRSFIREVPNDPEDRAIAEAIIAMGKTLSLTVVAEGVETPEQQAFLSERLCDEMQGFYFSTPVAAQDFAELLRGHAPKPLR